MRFATVLAVATVLAAGCSSTMGTTTPPVSITPPSITPPSITPPSITPPSITMPSATSPSAAAIVIKNFTFAPADLTVSPGERVTVQNQDSTAHTVTTAAGSSETFDTGDIAPGASATFTAPAKAGTYAYMCSIHQYMHGTLTVH